MPSKPVQISSDEGQQRLMCRPSDKSTLEDCDAMLRNAKNRIAASGWSDIMRWYVDEWLDKQSELQRD
jgi:hypothetical protein